AGTEPARLRPPSSLLCRQLPAGPGRGEHAAAGHSAGPPARRPVAPAARPDPLPPPGSGLLGLCHRQRLPQCQESAAAVLTPIDAGSIDAAPVDADLVDDKLA